MADYTRRIDRILEADFLRDVQSRPITEIRLMKSDCAEEEKSLSYERSLLHSRLKLLRAELDRRAEGVTSSLVDSLPGILADERRASRGAFPGGDPFIPDKPSRRVSKLVSDDTLLKLPTMPEDEIKAHIDEMVAVEREVSDTRARVHGVLDALNHELARRYQSGEADPGDVLSAH